VEVVRVRIEENECVVSAGDAARYEQFGEDVREAGLFGERFRCNLVGCFNDPALAGWSAGCGLSRLRCLGRDIWYRP
jgi:hypothetical protein